MNQLSVKGQYTTASGQIIKFSQETPVWYSLANTCTTPGQLRKCIAAEANNLPELHGVAYWIKKANKREDFVKAIYIIFKKLAAAERDEGLASTEFFKAFVEAIIENQDFYWFSPAHFKLAIQRGFHGYYNEKGKVYGNKITIRHLLEWCKCFADEWFESVSEDYQNQKLATTNQARSTAGTVRDVFNKLDQKIIK